MSDYIEKTKPPFFTVFGLEIKKTKGLYILLFGLGIFLLSAIIDFLLGFPLIVIVLGTLIAVISGLIAWVMLIVDMIKDVTKGY